MEVEARFNSTILEPLGLPARGAGAAGAFDRLRALRRSRRGRPGRRNRRALAKQRNSSKEKDRGGICPRLTLFRECQKMWAAPQRKIPGGAFILLTSKSSYKDGVRQG